MTHSYADDYDTDSERQAFRDGHDEGFEEGRNARIKHGPVMILEMPDSFRVETPDGAEYLNMANGWTRELVQELVDKFWR